jgi:hypothetical protein
MVNDAPDISALIDKHLQERWAKEAAEHKPSGRKWTASGLGGCLRAQYLSRHVGVKARRKPDNKARKRWDVGKMWHAKFGEWFDEMKVLESAELDLSDAELDIAAFADFVVADVAGYWRCGIELKSVQSRTFWHRATYAKTVAKYENMMQSAMYSILARRKGMNLSGWLVVSVSKDDLTIEQDEVTDEHRTEALRRLEILRNSAATETAPDCTCLDVDAFGEGGWNWRWCDHYQGSEDSRTKQTEAPSGEVYKTGERKGQPKMVKKYVPDGPCCPVNELDWL